MVESSGTGNGTSLKTLSDRLEHFERILDVQNQNIGQLTADVAALASTVRTLHDNQKSLFSRHDRPLPWGAIIGGLSLIGICAGLLIAPIQSRLDKLSEAETRFEAHLVEDATMNGRLEERTEWLMKLEGMRWSKEHGK